MSDIKEILIKEEDIKRRIKEVAAEVRRDHEGQTVLAVCVLRGAVIFFADLLRELPTDTQLDFISVSSYAGTSSSGEVELIKDLSTPIAGKHLLIVEDIVDTGVTLTYLKKMFLARNPASVKICTLLNKPSRRTVDLVPEYCCFDVPNEFVIGYGLDYNEEYRTLKDVCILDPSVYEK